MMFMYYYQFTNQFLTQEFKCRFFRSPFSGITSYTHTFLCYTFFLSPEYVLWNEARFALRMRTMPSVTKDQREKRMRGW